MYVNGHLTTYCYLIISGIIIVDFIVVVMHSCLRGRCELCLGLTVAGEQLKAGRRLDDHAGVLMGSSSRRRHDVVVDVMVVLLLLLLMLLQAQVLMLKQLRLHMI